MPRDLAAKYKEPYLNAFGKTVEITHLEITYYTRKDDNKRYVVLPIDEVNEFVNRKGINGPYVSEQIRKEEARDRGLL